jgi:MoaA/NifB/PqqE/SkfB family radical SAM enzyme
MSKIKNKKTFCILPWIHLNTWPNGNVYQCCITNFKNTCGSTVNNTLEEIWNNDYMKDLRVKMINGQEHESCERCYMLERNGLSSFRQSANKNFEQHIESSLEKTTEDGHNEEFKLLYWDFRFSNICNLKCRMCGSGLSSSWYDDHVKMLQLRGLKPTEPRVIEISDYSKKDFKEYIVDFIDYVEEIYFAGGEPLLMDEHYFILDELLKRGRTDVRIRYNTNLTKLKYKKWNVLDYWKKFKNVSIFASIDAEKDLAEYIRSGTKWETLDKNIKQIVEHDPEILGANITLQILNIFNLPEILDYLLRSGVNYHKILISNVVSFPQYYSCQLLPDDLKLEVINIFNNHLSSLSEQQRLHFKNQYDGVIEFMNSKMDGDIEIHRQTFKKMIKLLDKLRDEDINNSVDPRLVKWFKTL